MNNLKQPYSRGQACCSTVAQQECSCAREDMPGFPLGMAYVPWQPWGNLYTVDQALCKGTLFRDLDLDFLGRRCN